MILRHMGEQVNVIRAEKFYEHVQGGEGVRSVFKSHNL